MLLLYNEAQAYAWASVFQKKIFVVILFWGREGGGERGGILGLFLPDMESQ
jgi:hypothetical protein